MVREFEFEKSLAKYRLVYEDFLLPVYICDTRFDVRWRNRAAETLYPQLDGAGAMRRLLGEFDAGELLAKLKRDGVRRVDGALAFTGIRLNLTPMLKGREIGGVIVIPSAAQAGINRHTLKSSLDIVDSSKTPENIERIIRASVTEMFGFMDGSAEKAGWIGNTAMLGAFAGIERSGYRLLRVAADISNYTRFQVDPPRAAKEAIDVFDFIRRSQAALFAFAQETGVGVRFGLPGEDKYAVAAIDAGHLQLVYSNLINNAFFFTKPGNIVEITGVADDNAISFTVSDKGVGIPEDILSRGDIFKPYFSYAGCGKTAGIGLGLTLVKMIAEGCGGTITVKSVENEGTSATFTLPNNTFSASLPFRQETAETRLGGYNDRFSYASVSLRAAADSPYRQD